MCNTYRSWYYVYHRLRNGTSNTFAFIKIPRIAYTRMAFIIYGNTFLKVIVVYRVTQSSNTKTHSKDVVLRVAELLRYCFSRLTELHIKVPST